MTTKHPIEDETSHQLHLSRRSTTTTITHRQLHHPKGVDAIRLEHEAHAHDEEIAAKRQHRQDKLAAKAEKKRRKRFAELYRSSSGIGKESVHGLMVSCVVFGGMVPLHECCAIANSYAHSYVYIIISHSASHIIISYIIKTPQIDAGSTGSRMHIYQFAPRILADKYQVESAVRGSKLSYPGIESRWTERLRPGLATFGSLEGEALTTAIAEYLSPLLEFAKGVLHTKQNVWDRFPIFLKATAGMRRLPIDQRQRIIDTVRTLFQNSTYCPFWDEKERVRVISGEEEAVYGWAGVNFLLGNLMQRSEGAGEAGGSAIRTFGALDMGGASTQISFYEPNGDVMSGLFKLQIGQGKHWNVYAHSHLMFGHNAAEERFMARLVKDANDKERLIDGVYNPCLPGGGKKRLEFKSNVHFDERGMETWDAQADGIPSVDTSGSYHAVLVNNKDTGDWEQCKSYANKILNSKSNAWCEFSHQGSCSFAGVYQPELPSQDEFFAFR